MFRIPAINAIKEEAKKRARDIGKLNNSIRGGAGNYAGCSFEVAFQMLFGGNWSTGKNIYQYDLLMENDWLARHKHGRKVDCKAKERTRPRAGQGFTVPFDLDWEASVADHAGLGVEQKCDSYAFGSVSVDSRKEPLWIWFLGGMNKYDYLNGRIDEIQPEGELDGKGRPLVRWNDRVDGAEFRKKGVPYDDNGFTCNEDCWNRKYSSLDSYELIDIPRQNFQVLREIIAQARREWFGGSAEYLLTAREPTEEEKQVPFNERN